MELFLQAIFFSCRFCSAQIDWLRLKVCKGRFCTSWNFQRFAIISFLFWDFLRHFPFVICAWQWGPKLTPEVVWFSFAYVLILCDTLINLHGAWFMCLFHKAFVPWLSFLITVWMSEWLLYNITLAFYMAFCFLSN